MKHLNIIIIILFLSCKDNVILKVTKIDLRSKSLTAIPDSIFEYENLAELNLGAKEVVFYPPLSELIEENNERNRITELPERISELKDLKELILNSNELKSLPQSITKLKKLEVLDLSLNKNLKVISEIEKLKLLPKLKVLKIANTEFSGAELELIEKSLDSKIRIVSSEKDYLEFSISY